MSGCDDMYNDICKEEFKGLHEKLDAIDTRLFKSNGKRSIVETIRDNEKALDRHIEEGKKPAAAKTILGGYVRCKPIESRDLPRIIVALGMVVLILERFGALEPIIAMFQK